MLEVVVLSDRFRVIGGAEEFRADPTVGPCPMPQGLEQRSKLEEVVLKMVHRRDSDQDNPEGNEEDPAVVTAARRFVLLFYPA